MSGSRRVKLIHTVHCFSGHFPVTIFWLWHIIIPTYKALIGVVVFSAGETAVNEHNARPVCIAQIMWAAIQRSGTRLMLLLPTLAKSLSFSAEILVLNN